jgi:hypothetical protein
LAGGDPIADSALQLYTLQNPDVPIDEARCNAIQECVG